MPVDDPVFAELRALPARRIDRHADERALRVARAVLAEPGVHRGLLQWLQTIWSRALAPALVMATVAGYLVWAVHVTDALYR